MHELHFAMLGPVEVRVGTRLVKIGGSRAQAVVASLLLEPNVVIPLQKVVEACWGQDPPETARFQAQNRISALRRALREAGAGQVIATLGSGYRLDLPPAALDATDFTDRVQQAEQRLAGGDLPAAADLLTGALALWRGEALAGLTTPRLRAAAHRLDEARLAARELLFDVALRQGRHHELIPELLELTGLHPWRERLTCQLMTALYRAGRQHDALAAYEAARKRLATELGTDPGAELRSVRDQILREAPELGAPGGFRPAATLSASRSVTGSTTAATAPRTLPRSAPGFTGRSQELARLDAAGLNESEVNLCVIAGGPGVGKTALALHWAHQRAAHFPDGQLYVDLHGYRNDPPASPVEVLRQLLHALRLPPEQIPPDEVRAVDCYRATLAGRRLLVVLDNVTDPAAVRQLLPPGAGSAMLVVSRHRLTGLTAIDGAHRLVLGPLRVAEAVDVLRGQLGADRADREPALAELAAACGYLPLALRIAAAHLEDRPERSVAGYVAELRRGGRLERLRVDGDDSAAVGPAFERSYTTLEADSARTFRFLGCIPGPDFDASTVAAMLGVPADRAALALDRLASAHLIEPRDPGARFGLHDLLRDYAVDRLAAQESQPVRAAATGRLFAYYLGHADAASRQLFPSALRLPGPAGVPTFHDREAALAWLDAQSPALVAAALAAGQSGRPELAWRLADALRSYFWLRRANGTWQAVATAGVVEATVAGDPVGQAAAAFSLGMAELSASRYERATTHLRQANALGREAGWSELTAATLGNLGIAYSELGQLDRAVAHYQQALAVNDALDRPAGRANNLGNLGLLQLRMGELRSAAEHLGEAAALHRTLGSTHHYAVFAHGLGQATRLLGRVDESRALLTAALQAAREVRDPDRGVLVGGDLVALYEDLGEQSAAAGQRAAIRELLPAVGDPDVTVLGWIAQALGPAAARRPTPEQVTAADTACRLAAAGDNQYLTLLAATCAAATSLGAGRWARARQQAQAAADRAAELGFGIIEADARTVLAAAALDGGDPSAALRQAGLAAARHRACGYRRGESRTLAILDRAAADLAAAVLPGSDP